MENTRFYGNIRRRGPAPVQWMASANRVLSCRSEGSCRCTCKVIFEALSGNDDASGDVENEMKITKYEQRLGIENLSEFVHDLIKSIRTLN
jgi:hypothetical protein